VNIEKFLEVLAARLDAVVPDDYEVNSDGDMLWFGSHSGSYARHAYETYLDHLDDMREPHPGRDPRFEPITHDEVIAAVATKAMDELQDTVDENTREPWPGNRTVPRPHAIVENGVLLMWFGDRIQPALRLDPIELAEVE
jgi:hypothetical protein